MRKLAVPSVEALNSIGMVGKVKQLLPEESLHRKVTGVTSPETPKTLLVKEDICL